MKLNVLLKTSISVVALSLGVGLSTAYAAQTGTSESAFTFNQIKSAALAGDKDAQYALGFMYFYGKGTGRNVPLAKFWISKAAKQGQQQAVKALAILRQGGDNTNVVSKEGAQSSAQPSARKVAHSAQTRTTDLTNRRSHASRAEQARAHQSSANELTAVRAHSAKRTPDSVGSASASAPIRSSMRARILNTPSRDYTLQLFATHYKSHVSHFINRNNLGSRAMYYRIKQSGEPMYVVIYGHYSTRRAANEAKQSLPRAVRKGQPWIKSFSAVKRQIG